jgi:hypothetical protein
LSVDPGAGRVLDGVSGSPTPGSTDFDAAFAGPDFTGADLDAVLDSPFAPDFAPAFASGFAPAVFDAEDAEDVEDAGDLVRFAAGLFPVAASAAGPLLFAPDPVASVGAVVGSVGESMDAPGVTWDFFEDVPPGERDVDARAVVVVDVAVPDEADRAGMTFRAVPSAAFLCLSWLFALFARLLAIEAGIAFDGSVRPACATFRPTLAFSAMATPTYKMAHGCHRALLKAGKNTEPNGLRQTCHTI